MAFEYKSETPEVSFSDVDLNKIYWSYNESFSPFVNNELLLKHIKSADGLSGKFYCTYYINNSFTFF